ncbi:hypothetical protein KO488_14535 [Poseidonibacter lekithochrous]|uniref:hypothetical protein n=1 Tax=Poseidonibacter TaxID=2321187 RepID=UPI001C093270|nr:MULTISPECIES: hypothetical protein [Poseidonibacter]MBU3015974.1 hypothetical protein [Poseidonibacter lekithochrous]MDO6829273.1 hypothetical protein [Poseidonibacter sp. 1_MG-2023]
MNDISLSLVRTPFQLFNCIEACKQFNNKGRNILICIYKNDVDKKLYDSIIDDSFWEKVYFYKLTFINKILYSINLNKILIRYKNIKYCFFGLITSYIIHSINKINATENILIDDGNETLLIANNLKKDEYIHKFKRNYVFTLLLKRCLSLNFLKKLEIFSFYDLTSFSLNNKIIKNEYIHFRKSINLLPMEKNIFFIGSNLINTYISREYFEKIIKNVLNYYSNYKITYIPHRYEDLEYLNALSIKLNFNIKKFSTILELGILEYGKRPLGLISIRSSALETIGYLYNIDFLNIIQIDTNMLLKEDQVLEYENLYINYKQKNIELIKIV